MFPDEFGKAEVGFLFLHREHLGHAAFRTAQFQFPVHEAFIDTHPVLPGLTVHDLHGYLLEVLLILVLCHLCLYFLAVNVLLQCQEYLIGIDGLDQVVGNLLADGLFHDIFLFALGHHHHGGRGMDFLDALQGFQTADTWHLLVQQHQVVVVLPTEVDGVSAIRDRRHLIAFLL